MTAAIEAVIQEHKSLPFDALIIIRGGGAVIDLAWLNDYALAKQLCQSPMVVFTGIGHERDNTILDEVASLRFDTPSKVIAYVFSRITDNAQTALKQAKEIKTEAHRLMLLMQHLSFDHFTTFTRTAERDFHQATQLMEQWYGEFYQMPRSLEFMAASLKQWFHRVEENSLASLHHLDLTIKNDWKTVHALTPQHLIETQQQVEKYWWQLSNDVSEGQKMVEERLTDLSHELYQGALRTHLQLEKSLMDLIGNIMGLGPTGTLKRGYALIRNPYGNKVITSKAEAETQSQLAIEFHDGSLNVKLI